MHEATDQWAIYEANVQAYRALSLTAQGFYLAVGAILLDNSSVVPFSAVGVLAAVTTWWLFFPVIFARTAIVDFHKYRLGDLVGADGTLGGDGSLAEKDYAHVTNWRVRRAVYREAVRQQDHDDEHPIALPIRTMRHTRLKLDLAMPVLFQVTWLVLAASAY